MSTMTQKHGVIDKIKYKKRASKQKWIEMEYHVQINDDVTHKYVKYF